MHGEAVRLRRVGVVAGGREEAGDIGRAAGAAEPADPRGLHRAAIMAAAGDRGLDLERVDVEKFPAVERHAGEDIVVEGAFHDVAELAAQLQVEHPAREEHQADRGAGLGVEPRSLGRSRPSENFSPPPASAPIPPVI